VVSALVASLDVVARARRRGWARWLDGAGAAVTGLPHPSLNGVWAVDPAGSVEAIEAALARVAAADLPYCLEASPACAAAPAAAAALGLVAGPEVGVYVAEGPVRGQRPPELAVRRLQPPEAALHAQIADAADLLPPGIDADALVTPAVLARPEVRGYVGEVGDRPVATALSVTTGDAVAAFDVATVPEHRRRGYATALVARAVSDARAAGASWSWLQASDAAAGLYERVGFTLLERWRTWGTN